MFTVCQRSRQVHNRRKKVVVLAKIVEKILYGKSEQVASLFLRRYRDLFFGLFLVRFFCCLACFEQKPAALPPFRRIYPIAINFRLAIHKFDNMNNMTAFAVFLASPR